MRWEDDNINKKSALDAIRSAGEMGGVVVRAGLKWKSSYVYEVSEAME